MGKEKKGYLYRRSLLMVLLFSILPTAFAVTALFYYSRRMVDDQIRENYLQQIYTRANQLENRVKNLEDQLLLWSLSSVFSRSIKDIDNTSFGEVNDIYNHLAVIAASDKLIESAGLIILKASGAIAFTDSWYYPTLTFELETLKNRTLSQIEQTFWVEMGGNDGRKYFLVRRLETGHNREYGILFFLISPGEMEDQLSHILAVADNFSLLLNSRGQMVFTSTELPVGFDPKRIPKTQNLYDSFDIMKISDVSYYLTPAPLVLGHTDFTLLTFFSIEGYVTPLYQLTMIILFVSLAGTITAIILSTVASRRIYKPISRLIDSISTTPGEWFGDPEKDEFIYINRHWQSLSARHHTLENRLDRIRPQFKEGVLIQLVSGGFDDLDEEEIYRRLEEYGWEMKGQVHQLILGLASGQTDEMTDMGEQFLSNSLSRFFKEILKEKKEVIGITSFQGLGICLLSYPENREETLMKKTSSETADLILREIQDSFTADLTLCISRIGMGPHEISTIYEEARRTVRFRELTDSYQVLGVDDIQFENQEINYPFETEKALLNGIRLNLEDEVRDYTELFFNQIENNSSRESELGLTVIQLVGQIQHEIMKTGINSFSLFGKAGIYEEIFSCHSSRELHSWFLDRILEPYLSYRGERDRSKRAVTVERAIELIEETPLGQLSQQLLADELNIPAYTISKAFKITLGMNFSEYLARYKISIAKDLLVNSDKNIQNISSECGYEVTQFIRAFKKFEGMTPGKFRIKNR